MKRSAIVCAALMLGSPVWSQYQPVPFEQIAGPNRSINEPKSGLSATVPLGWTIRRAQRKENGETSIALASSKTPAAVPSLYYQITEAPGGAPPGDIQASLRESAQKKAEQRLNKDGATDYKNRASSFVFRTIGGLPALSWEADYTREGRPWSEYLTRVNSDRGSILFFLNAAADDMASVRPGFERMIDTVRIGAPVTAQIGGMAFVQLLDVARIPPRGPSGAPDGMAFTFLMARNHGVTGEPTIKETRDMGIAGQSYNRATQEALGRVFEPGTTFHSAAKFLADNPRLSARAALDPATSSVLTIEMPGAPLNAAQEAAIILNVGYNKAVEKLTFHTKVPERTTSGQ